MNAFLFENPCKKNTKWFSFENPDGKKGAGGTKNNGLKGAPSRLVQPGESVTLVEYEGTTGIIDAIWVGVEYYNKLKGIHSLKIEFFWDGCDVPAVSAPFQEFFCHAASTHKIPFENWLFSSPEGRSFNCFVPMPFRKGCKVVITNITEDLPIYVFFCLQMTCNVELPEDFLYFHCLHQPMKKTQLFQDFEILPKISGTGRYLGTNIQLHAGDGYEETWFGEGEIKIYLDGDEEYPSLVGTGTEDYVLTSWGQGEFSTMNTGCTLYQVDDDGRLKTAFYRVHVQDPIYFHEDCRVTIQQMGGASPKDVRNSIQNQASLHVVSAALENGEMLWGADADVNYPTAYWINFLREDYIGAVTWFYLDRPQL